MLTGERMLRSDLQSDLTRGYGPALQQTLDGLLEHVVRMLGVDAADVLLYDAATRRLIYPGRGRGFRTRAFESSSSRLVNSLVGEVVQAREWRLTRNVPREKDPGTGAEFAAEGLVSYAGVPLIWNEQLKGILELFHRSSLNPNAAWVEAVRSWAPQAALALSNVLCVGRLQQSQARLTEAVDAIVEGWAHALELRDYEPAGHTARVARMTVDFARAAQVPEAQLVHIRRGAWLHDIGKMGIPDEILTKPESLTEADWVIMRRHPIIGYELLQPIEFLGPALDIPYCHHEKWDGTGYPRGLKGESIPLAARLFALVDVWDALSCNRPYREAWPEAKIHTYLQERADKQFDPKLTELFLRLIGSELWRKNSGGAERARGNYLETVIYV